MSRIYPYAGFWRRAVALMIDSFIISAPCTILYSLLVGVQAFRLAASATPMKDNPDPATFLTFFGTILIFQVLVLVVFWLYFAFMESGKWQATLGKKIMGIKVVGADGGRISFARATGRTFGKYISYMILNFGYYMAGFTKKRQALHDLMADTYVVQNAFQPGDEKPALAFSVWGLIASIFAGILPILLTIAGVILAIMLPIMIDDASSPASTEDWALPSKATTAKIQLLRFSGPNENTTFPLEKDGISYSKTGDNYRAEFTDKNGQRFALVYPTEQFDFCCAEGDCKAIELEPCK